MKIVNRLNQGWLRKINTTDFIHYRASLLGNCFFVLFFVSQCFSASISFSFCLFSRIMTICIVHTVQYNEPITCRLWGDFEYLSVTYWICMFLRTALENEPYFICWWLNEPFHHLSSSKAHLRAWSHVTGTPSLSFFIRPDNLIHENKTSHFRLLWAATLNHKTRLTCNTLNSQTSSAILRYIRVPLCIWMRCNLDWVLV